MTRAATIDRRRFLGALGALAATATTASTASWSRPARALATGASKPTSDGAALGLARRLSFGADAALVALARQGSAQYLADQLDPDKPENPALLDLLAALDDAQATVAGSADTQARRRFALGATTLQSLARAVFSRRQLHALLADTLSDQLHVAIPGDPHLFFTPDYDRRVIAGHALGHFDQALLASAQHPAMLTYLDQASSRADGDHVPNENYARELLELHTVGRAAGYSEAEVQAAAHVLSGWSLSRDRDAYAFRASRHRLGPATQRSILGWRASGAGEADGIGLLRHLAHHRATAQRVTARVARRLVDSSIADDDPLVDEIAAVYTANDTALAPVAAAVVGHERFTASLTTTTRVRRPFETVAALLRAGGSSVDSSKLPQLATTWYRLLDALDSVPHGWPAPDGYPQADAAYISPGTTLARWNVVSAIVMGSVVPGWTLVWPDSVDEIGTTVLGASPPADVRKVVAGAVGKTTGLDTRRRALAAALFASSPHFQLR